jgi:hypothetical protein
MNKKSLWRNTNAQLIFNAILFTFGTIGFMLTLVADRFSETVAERYFPNPAVTNIVVIGIGICQVIDDAGIDKLFEDIIDTYFNARACRQFLGYSHIDPLTFSKGKLPAVVLGLITCGKLKAPVFTGLHV